MTEPELHVQISSLFEYKNNNKRIISQVPWWTIMMWEIFMQQYSNTLELCMCLQLHVWYSRQQFIT